MDELDKLWNDIKESCRARRLELFLMLLFVIAAVGLSMDEISEAVSVSGPAAETESVPSDSERFLPETDPGETETEAYSKEASGEETEEAFGEPLVYHTLKDTLTLYGYDVVPPAESGPETEKEASGDELGRLLSRSVAGYDGDWSVYVKNLTTGEEAVVNDRPMKSASVMKLFIMGAVYEAFETGELERTDEIMSLMSDMIVYSDNPDSNRLLYYLGGSSYARGIARVNAFIDRYGFSDMTVEYNGFNDPATNTSSKSLNQVAARDCGRLLEAIYHREWVNRKVSNEIEQMMLSQDTRYKIPAGLPEGVSCGNKSGEMETTENDAAIIYGDKCDYILVVLSSDWTDKDTAISEIRSVSAQVYEYFDKNM